MALIIGVFLALAVGVLATATGLDRDRAFYPTVTIVVALYYVLFAVMGGSSHALILESIAVVVFLVAAVYGFRRSLWIVAAALAAHGVFDKRGRWTLRLGVLVTMLSLPAMAQEPATIGLDHIPVAVRDLDRASATYRGIGFALKPGRHHANGIRNAHVKFPDGAGIELLTAPKAIDALSARYVDHLRAGEGPAFVSFHARDTERLHAALRDGGHEFRQNGEITTLLAPEFSFLFFVRDNRSPTDQPKHFAHANGATGLNAVWVASENGESLARLLVLLGGLEERRTVSAPDPVEATVVRLGEGEVVILPGRHRLLPGRPVIGASFRVRDPAKVGRMLAEAGIEPRAGTRVAERVVVGPESAHGLWLQFTARRLATRP